jgi:GMP synthase (glutamine-hydrolysing)
MSRRRVVVIENMPQASLDRFALWLDDVDVEIVRSWRGEPVPQRVTDGLIVLGGSMSFDNDVPNNWLPAVRDLLARSVADAVPTLGICLGAQLLAVACGGTVEVAAAPGKELGVIDVRWKPAARHDPLVAGLPDPFPGPSWHRDAILTLPPDAVWLGDSAMYPYQAFRVGDAAWGVQFHPEASLEGYRVRADRYQWAGGAAAVASYQARQDEVTAAGRALARRFAQVCREAAEPQRISGP